MLVEILKCDEKYRFFQFFATQSQKHELKIFFKFIAEG
jgi:hypothetical protein